MSPKTIFNSADPLDLYYYQLLDYLQGEISEGRMTSAHAGQVIAEAQTLVNNAYCAAADNNIPIETGLENLLASLPYYDDVKTVTGPSTRAFGDYLTGNTALTKADNAAQGITAAAMSAYDTSGMLQDMSSSWLQHPDTRTMLERAAELGVDVSSYLAQLSDPGVWNHEAGAPRFVGELRQQMSDKQALKNRRRAQYAAAIMPDEFQAIAAEVEADYLKDAGSEEVITTGFEPEMANAHDVFFGKLQRNSQWQQRLDDYEKRMSQDYGDLWQEYQETMLDPANDLVSWEEYTRSTPELQMRYENYEKYKRGTQHRDYNMYAPPVRYI